MSTTHIAATLAFIGALAAIPLLAITVKSTGIFDRYSFEGQRSYVQSPGLLSIGSSIVSVLCLLAAAVIAVCA